jgi:hypothetical protein
VADNDIDETDANLEPEKAADPPADAHRSVGRVVLARLGGRGRLAGILALAAIAALIGGAYVVGGPSTSSTQTDALRASLADKQLAAATAGPAALSVGGNGSGASAGVPSASSAPPAVDGQSQLLASIDAAQIVKTGQLSLEVNDIEGALSQAQATVVGLGGYVDQSNRSGTGTDATASITYRVPADEWDDALTALRKIGARVLSEQTGTSDVTSQVIDLNARITNLKTTEAALQSIMARTTAIADVIAVESQLSDTQGQIEELTAERDHLTNQAAMSTLTVTFQLPAATVTAQATQDWTLGSQIDQAGAALVRIGQGLATVAVWVLVVVLPLSFGALVLFGILWVARRLLGRRRRRNAAAGA